MLNLTKALVLAYVPRSYQLQWFANQIPVIISKINEPTKERL